MLQRLFCLGPSHHGADGEWVVARTQHHQTQALYTASKILDIVEAEVDERFKSTKASKRAALEPNSMRRLHRANLPMEDSQRATEIISKLTSIDNSKLRFQKEYARMEQELAEAKEEKRLAEFGQARAEQLAIARGEALYGCQERLAEAERQQVQLADVLKLTLDKLGMGLTPSPAQLQPPEYERSPGHLPDRPSGPLFANPSGHLPQRDTSSTMIAPVINTELAADQKRQQHHSSSASEPDTPLSGFTVYSNELHDSPGGTGRSRSYSPSQYNNNCNGDASYRYPGHLEDLRPSSATKWKDISEVVNRSRSHSPTGGDCATPLGPAPLGAATAGAGMKDNNESTLAAASTNGLNADKEAERLAQLIIPHLEASQLESLVRFGASLGSPTLASPTMQRHLIDALRKSRSNEEGIGDRDGEKEHGVRYQQPSMPRIARPPPQVETTAAPAMPAPRPAMLQQQQQRGGGFGPLSQAAGWTSPGLNGSSGHHIKTVFENATTTSDGSAGNGGENGFYKPFSAVAPASGTEQNTASRDTAAMPAPLPKKSTFRIGAAQSQSAQQQRYVGASSIASEGDTIKAVMPHGVMNEQPNSSRVVHSSNDGVPDDDRFARQRRAAERLAAKINSKLPPEYRTADPLGLGTRGQQTSHAPTIASRAASTASTSSGASGSGGKRPPKGSLRRQQAEAYAADAISTARN